MFWFTNLWRTATEKHTKIDIISLRNYATLKNISHVSNFQSYKMLSGSALWIGVALRWVSLFWLSAASICSLAALLCTCLRALQQLLQTVLRLQEMLSVPLRSSWGCRHWQNREIEKVLRVIWPLWARGQTLEFRMRMQVRVPLPLLGSSLLGLFAVTWVRPGQCVPFPLPINLGMAVRENRSLFLLSPGVYCSLCCDIIYF